MKRQHTDLEQKGFTIIELLIASTVFTTILLICTTGLIQIGRVYQKGVLSSQVQESTRSIIDEITRAIQFDGGTVTSVRPIGSGGPPPSPSNYFCIDDKRFSFVLGKQLLPSSTAITDTANETHRALVVDDAAACMSGQDLGSPATLAAGSKELLAPNMRLAKLIICTPGMAPDANCAADKIHPSGSGLYHVSVRVIYGSTDILTATKDTCTTDRSAAQFCALSELNTTVQKRLE